MIKKEVKQYKQGNSYSYRINISKQDKLTGNVYVLTPREYEQLNNENRELKRRVDNQHERIAKLQSQLEDHEKHNKTMLEKLEKINTKQLETILEQDKHHSKQLNESNELYIDDFKKFVAITQLHHQALNQIDEMGFIDILLKKYKKIIWHVKEDNALDFIKYFEKNDKKEYIPMVEKEK
ncbi:MAG: DUF3450 domain-containing protein [Firmicutes bacterium]|nr:DUF3450 domain-containing protein [Bacillota bacterium]